MFTGIVQGVGTVRAIEPRGGDVTLVFDTAGVSLADIELGGPVPRRLQRQPVTVGGGGRYLGHRRRAVARHRNQRHRRVDLRGQLELDGLRCVDASSLRALQCDDRCPQHRALAKRVPDRLQDRRAGLPLRDLRCGPYNALPRSFRFARRVKEHDDAHATLRSVTLRSCPS